MKKAIILLFQKLLAVIFTPRPGIRAFLSYAATIAFLIILYNIFVEVRGIRNEKAAENNRSDFVIDSLTRETGEWEAYVVLLKSRDSIYRANVHEIAHKIGKSKYFEME